MTPDPLEINRILSDFIDAQGPYIYQAMVVPKGWNGLRWQIKVEQFDPSRPALITNIRNALAGGMLVEMVATTQAGLDSFVAAISPHLDATEIDWRSALSAGQMGQAKPEGQCDA